MHTFCLMSVSNNHRRNSNKPNSILHFLSLNICVKHGRYLRKVFGNIPVLAVIRWYLSGDSCFFCRSKYLWYRTKIAEVHNQLWSCCRPPWLDLSHRPFYAEQGAVETPDVSIKVAKDRPDKWLLSTKLGNTRVRRSLECANVGAPLTRLLTNRRINSLITEEC